jgi:hypothetical protein
MLGLGALALLALVLIPSRPRISTADDQAPMISTAGAPGVQPTAQDLAGRAALLEVQPATNTPAKENASRVETLPRAAQEEQREAQVATRVAQLHDLSRKTDPASLATLLSEVRNPDQDIRQAALDAISQSGNRNAIPALQEAAAQTENPAEQQAIEEVIEFLKLPTLTEILREQRSTSSNAPPNRP